MAIPLIDGFGLGAKIPLDVRTVHKDVATALSEITRSMRYKGLQVFITDLEQIYWFKTGVEDKDFVEFKEGGNTFAFYEFKILANGKDSFTLSDEILQKAKYHYATYNGVLLYPENDYKLETSKLVLLNGLTMDSTDEFRFYYSE